jgi:hypothetical protein
MDVVDAGGRGSYAFAAARTTERARTKPENGRAGSGTGIPQARMARRWL